MKARQHGGKTGERRKAKRAVMKNLVDQLAQYAAYHRDARNIYTHFVGVPMIVLAVAVLLSRPVWPAAGWPVSPALLLGVAAAVYYCRLDKGYGVCLSAVLAAMLGAGAWLAQQSTPLWLLCGLGLLVVGWTLQFVGHYWERRKPAFMDDIVGLLIGPLFVAAEMGFALGLRPEVEQAVRARAGPVRGAVRKPL